MAFGVKQGMKKQKTIYSFVHGNSIFWSLSSYPPSLEDPADCTAHAAYCDVHGWTIAYRVGENLFTKWAYLPVNLDAIKALVVDDES